MARMYTLRLRANRTARPVRYIGPAPAAEPVPEPVPEPAPEPSEVSGFRPGLGFLSKAELVELAESEGVDSSGTKADIIERLEAADG